MKEKKSLIFKVIMFMFLLIMIGLFSKLIIILDNKNKDVLEKISKINNLNNDIVQLENNYNYISNKQDLINQLTKKNDDLSNNIDGLTNDIKDLNFKISKYKK